VLAEKQLARAQLLYDKGAIALADLETAQDAHAKSDVDLQAAIAHVKVLGGDISNPTTMLPLRALSPAPSSISRSQRDRRPLAG